jgi:hypothetical protein
MRCLFFLLFILACNSSSSSKKASSSFSLTPTCFTPEASNPILAKDDLLTGATWNDPHVIQEGAQFVMYASADNNFDENIQIYRMVSTDGKNWSLAPSTPVFSKATGGSAWDRKSVETPAVVKFNGLYYLFYTGYPTTQSDATTYKIGYATSSDGISWTRQPTTFAPTDPAGSPNLDFNQFIVAEPAPVVFNNKIYLYFTALGADVSVGTTLQTIGLTTFDGSSWSSPQKVLSPDQTLYPRGSNWKGYSTPHAAFLNNQVHLFFDVVSDSPFFQKKIHHAQSSDGVTNWTQDSQAIFDRSQFSPWANVELRAPAVLQVGSTLYLWMAGNGDTSTLPTIDMGIGLAKCDL